MNIIKIKSKFDKIRSLRQKYVFIVIYLGVSLITTVLWFGHGDFLVYTDTHFPFLNLPKYTERLFNVMDTAYFPSVADFRHLFLYSYASYFLPFHNLWTPFIASLAQHLLLLSLIFFSFVSVHLFLSEISSLGKQNVAALPALITGLIYIFNVFAAIIIWRPFMPPAMFHYAFFPMFIVFSIRYFTSADKKYLILLLLLSWLIFSTYNAPTNFIFDVLFLAVVFLSIRKLLKKSWRHYFRNLAIVWTGIIILAIPILLVILSNPLLPLLRYEQLGFFSTSLYGKLAAVPVKLLDFLTYNSPSLDRAFFYSGYPPLYGDNNSWYATGSLYLEPLMLLLIGGLICIGILTILKNKKYYLYAFPALWLFFIFLFTGSNNPLSSVKLFIFEQILREPFRGVFSRLGEYVILASVPIIYFGIIKLFSIELQIKTFQLNKKIIITFSLLSILLLSSFPIIDGSFLEKQQNSKVPSNQVNFPDSYLSLQDLNKVDNGDFFYITIPTSFGLRVRSWDNGTAGYIGPDIFPFILQGKEISSNKIRDNIMGLIMEGKVHEVQSLIPIRYIIVTFDQTDESSKATSENYYKVLKNNQNLSLIYYDQRYMAIFEIPESSTKDVQARGKQLFILSQENPETRIAKEIFLNSRLTLASQNSPLEGNYFKGNRIAGIFDFTELNKTQVISKIQLGSFSNDTIFFPLFIEFPNVSERIYVAVRTDPVTRQLNIFAGSWLNSSKEWTFIPLYSSLSYKLSFLADFSRNLIIVDDGLTEKKIPMPDEWINIIRLRTSGLGHLQGSYGDIGVYANKNLSALEVNFFQVKAEGHSDTYTLAEPVNRSGVVTINNILKISPSSFIANLNATQPFMIVLADAYDSAWIASIKGERISSNPVFGGINGFLINQTGQLEIHIEYETQQWFSRGIILTLVIFVTVVLYFTYSYLKVVNTSKRRALQK